jgi:ligand-binding sensor domain-containing protein
LGIHPIITAYLHLRAMNNKSILVLLLLFATSSNAQKWTNYKTSDGLVDDYVYAIAFDSHGNEWVGTNGGVSKYDGTTWTNYTISNSGLATDRVNVIAIDEDDNKWIGTWGGGVSKFDGINWTTFLNYAIVTDINIDAQKNIWFSTNSGAIKYDGTNWSTYYPAYLVADFPKSILVDKTGNVWVGTMNGGLSKFDGTNWTKYSTANSGLPNNRVSSLAIDSLGNLWIANGAGLSIFDGVNWTNYTGLPINDIAIDTLGYMWDAIGGWYGADKFDGTKWITYINPNGITCEYMCVTIDSQGTKWYGTYGNGIFKFEDITTGMHSKQAYTKNENILTFSPNPSLNETKISFPIPAKYTLIISDINGKIVKSISGINDKEIWIVTKGMKPGIYLASVTYTANKITYRGKFIVAE